MARSRAAPGGLEAGDGLRLSPRVGRSQVTAGSRGQAHGEPQQCRRYASRRQLVVFHVVIVLKCQRGKGFNAASPVRNARDSSQRPGGVLITGSAETVQPQRASLPDLLRSGWLARRRGSAPFALLTPPVVPGWAPRPPAGSSPPALGKGHWGAAGAPPEDPRPARQEGAKLRHLCEGRAKDSRVCLNAG